MNYAFDCILGIPWLVRYQPQIDWLARSVKRPQGFDVSEVFAHLVVAPRDWPHVTVVDGASTTHMVHRASDGSLCTTCAVLLTGEDEEGHAREDARERQASAHLRSSRMKNVSVEQQLPHVSEATEQWLPRIIEAVEQRFPHAVEAVERGRALTAGGGCIIVQRERNLSLEQGLETHKDLPQVAATIDASPMHIIEVASPPRYVTSITYLPGLFWKTCLQALKAGDTEQVCLITDADSVPHEVNPVELDDASLRPKSSEPKSAREERFDAQSCETLNVSDNPVHETVREFADVFPDTNPAALPTDRGVLYDIDLAPGAKYCVTRQWPLPRDQGKTIDDLFEGSWRIVHAFNKLNDATIPARTLIPGKDMVLDSMPGSVVFSAIDLTDGFYQILMRESDIPLTAVSTPSGMLWEWLVMPQGLKNAPVTFNRMVSHVLRLLHDFAPSYFDDIFVHSRAEDGFTAVEVHIRHLRQVFQVVRENKLYTNLKKCAFCAPEIPVLGCYVGKKGVRADPEKVSSICLWPTPTSLTEFRQWLGLANDLHKYTNNYAGLIQPLSSLLKKDATWFWRPEHQAAFDSPYHVVRDASDFAIGCALMQFDNEGHERVVSHQSRQMKPNERNYPVHDKELLAMRYAPIKFRVYLLGKQAFAVYTDHASLRTAMKSPHLSQRMARWLSFIAEYNFVVHYKPDKNNILADALSRRPDNDPRINLTSVSPEMNLRDEIVAAYTDDAVYANILGIDRYHLDGDLLYYNIDLFDAPRVVVPNDDNLKFLFLAEFARNNAEHSSTGLTPFFANNTQHPRGPALLAVGHPTVSGASTLGGDDESVNDDYVEKSGAHDPETLYAVTRSKAKQALATPGPAASPLAAWTARTLIDPGNTGNTGTQVAANYAPTSPTRQVDNAAVSAFVQRRASIARFVRDALQDAVDKQKENADRRGRKNMATFRIGKQDLLSTDGIRSSAVTNLGASKLAPRFIGPFRVVKVNGEAYTLDIPTSLQLHPTFYVGRLKKYHRAAIPSAPPTTAAASPSAVLHQLPSPRQ
ncbi:Retrovirus Polyprotein [Phytophthora palmivora]|uniref:Retrovirus Polyprotein n=1 Tax=Phytophthora palmivora TaxID=4796 RepID=A0A2P4XGL4_9STRA|nr:Retrovirus Polyprotein [Phytophthora palmivora]